MDELLDDHLRLLSDQCRSLATGLRGPGQALDDDPDAITRFLDHPVVRLQRHSLVPEGYTDDVFRLRGRTYDLRSCRERVVVWERLCYGDPNVLLASPGPLMCGAAVLALADEQQQRSFFERIVSAPTWTFFGLTEPVKGSAAAELQTALRPHGDDFVLNGEKCYVGNGAHSQLGVVFCRRGPGPLGIAAVLVDTSTPGFEAELLPTIGLRGARISKIVMRDVLVPRDQVLGKGSRGLTAAVQTLMWFRPVVAAMALGVARAVVDHVLRERAVLNTSQRLDVEDLADRVAAAFALTLRAAADVDAGAADHHAVSGVKMAATSLAESAALLASDLLGPSALVEDRWLNKAYRDVRAFEFMEGTSDVHRLSVFHGVLKETVA